MGKSAPRSGLRKFMPSLVYRLSSLLHGVDVILS
jgi:hypothetical protein